MRARVKRRERARLEARQRKDFSRELGRRGFRGRLDAVNAGLAPDAPVFWRIFKERLKAAETFGPIRSLDAVRDLALAVLREDGHDLAGITLKVFWDPPALLFTAIPVHEVALEVVKEVQGSPKGAARLREMAAVERR